MKKVKYVLDTGYSGCSHTEIFEVDDGMSDNELDNYLQEWVFEYISASWEIIEDER